jgi:hypothetical protein
LSFRSFGHVKTGTITLSAIMANIAQVGGVQKTKEAQKIASNIASTTIQLEGKRAAVGVLGTAPPFDEPRDHKRSKGSYGSDIGPERSKGREMTAQPPRQREKRD